MEFTTYINIAYLVAAICFIYGLKMLSHPRTARNGNIISSINSNTIAIYLNAYSHKESSRIKFEQSEFGPLIQTLNGLKNILKKTM